MLRTILRAKLRRQRVDHPLVARPDLVQRIQASTNGDVTTVIAPAGYGKTTIITQWAAQTALPVAWFSIDDTDNDLVQFLSYLASAIQTIFPDACMHLLELLDALAPCPIWDTWRQCLAMRSMPCPSALSWCSTTITA